MKCVPTPTTNPDNVSYKLIRMGFYHRRRRGTRGNAGQRQGSWCDFMSEDSRAQDACEASGGRNPSEMKKINYSFGGEEQRKKLRKRISILQMSQLLKRKKKACLQALQDVLYDVIQYELPIVYKASMLKNV